VEGVESEESLTEELVCCQGRSTPVLLCPEEHVRVDIFTHKKLASFC